MLYPQTNSQRVVIDLSGFWDVKVDAEAIGEQKKWQCGFAPDSQIGVPGSWNEQLAELGFMNYVGCVWYQKHFTLPKIFEKNLTSIRFGSADYQAKVWVNGSYVDEHIGGYLPFEFDITDFLNYDGENILVVCVDNRLSHNTIPQGITKDDYKEFNRERDQT